MFHTLMICHESNIAHRSDARVEHLVLPGSAPTSQICSSGARRRMTASTNGDVALVRTRSPFARNTFRTRLGLAKRIRSAALRRGEARVRFFIRTRILALPHRQSTRAIDVGTELKGCICIFKFAQVPCWRHLYVMRRFQAPGHHQRRWRWPMRRQRDGRRLGGPGAWSGETDVEPRGTRMTECESYSRACVCARAPGTEACCVFITEFL